VVITGHGDHAHHQAAIAAGYDAYLVKPLNLTLLKEILDAIEGARKQAS